MCAEREPFLEVVYDGWTEAAADDTPRDRRGTFRVSLPSIEAAFTSPLRLVDVSLSGIGFLARREDAPLLTGARLLIHLSTHTTLQAEVQRIELGTVSETWVRGGARFVDLGEGERAAVSKLVTTRRL